MELIKKIRSVGTEALLVIILGPILLPFIILAFLVNGPHSYFRTRYMKKLATKWQAIDKSVVVAYYDGSDFREFIENQGKTDAWKHVILINLSHLDQMDVGYKEEAIEAFDKYHGYEDYDRAWGSVYDDDRVKEAMQVRALHIYPDRKEKYHGYFYAWGANGLGSHKPSEQDYRELHNFIEK